MGDPLEKFLKALEAEGEERRKALAAERKAREEALAAERKAREEALEESRKRQEEALAADRKASQEADERLGRRIEQVFGDFGRHTGTIWESLAAPYVMQRLETTDGLAWVEPLENRYVVDVDEEFDLYGTARKNGVTLLVVGEVKQRLMPRDVEIFALKVADLERLHRRRVIKVLFGGGAQRDVAALAGRHGIRLVVHRHNARRRRRAR